MNIKEKLQSKKKIKKILFARRFVDYRGVLIFSNAVKKLLLIYDNLFFTFAGDGHYELFLKEYFKNNKNVNFIKFTQADSISTHFDYDIAIVPSLYSEGTSLSLLEAMSAGCFPIASIVGGLTNIIINNFNGILIKPTEEDIIESINNLLDMDSMKFDEIVLNAYKTANMSFNKTNWESKWTNLLLKI
jgi:glycosyltransferase involved in cell wall biosynthesis